jgi:hypothetical protein
VKRSDLRSNPNTKRRAADAVKCGDSVRISGLGTLKMWRRSEDLDETEIAYRLTLTANVYKRDASTLSGTMNTSLSEDVQRLAIGLDAPVEVWSPGDKKGPQGEGSKYIASVSTTGEVNSEVNVLVRALEQIESAFDAYHAFRVKTTDTLEWVAWNELRKTIVTASKLLRDRREGS